MSRKAKTDQRKRGGGGGAGGDEEVDLLLRAAEDELLLNLSVGSHMSRGVSHATNSYIDPDLDRRFQSLKSSRPTATRKPPAGQPQPKPQQPALAAAAAADTDDDDDDLLARFVALKESLPSSSSFLSNCLDDQSNRTPTASDEVDEDEVQKLIQWAVDAARLDPSPPTDSDDEDRDDGSSNDDCDDGFSYHGDSIDHQNKGGRKQGQKSK